MSFVRRIPVPMSALALGAAGLGNLLLPYSPALRAACGVTAAVVAALVALRLIADFRGVAEELENPAVLAVAPTFFMALMLLATYVKPYAAAPAKALWLVALAAQLLVVAVFVVRFVLSFDLARVLPAWFLVFVGFVVGSVTSPAFGMQPVGRVLLYAGLAGYVGVLPVIVYRLLKGAALPHPALPTLAIFAAPPSLCLAGYLAVTPAKLPAVVYALLAVAAASLLFVLASLPRMLRVRFCPAHAALTFPVVISAIALKQSKLFLTASHAAFVVPKWAVTTMDAFATLIVLYVLVRYVAYLAAPTPVAEPQPEAATA